jgi:hypothetical protein
MEDLFLALLSGAAELLIEVVFQWIAEELTVATIRSVRNVAEESKAVSPVLAATGYLLLGAGFGAVSVLFLPHPLVHPSGFHGISLVVSPLITGLIMSQIGILRRRKGKDSLQIESFGYGFTFALGVALIRFFFVR